METHVSPLSTGSEKVMEEARPSIAKFKGSAEKFNTLKKYNWIDGLLTE
jgi:hypothetical protein